MSWGGGRASSWAGWITLSEGTLQVENVLGLEADAAGVAVSTRPNTIRLLPRSPRTYDGCDVLVRAPRDAVVRCQFTSTTNEQVPASFEVPLSQLVGGRFTKELDAAGNRFAVHRTAGDTLRVISDHDHFVFQAGEAFECRLTPHLLEAAASTTGRCSLRLMSVATRTPVWQKDEDLALDEQGSADGLELSIPLPEEEGVYELVAEFHSKRFATPLVRGKPLAERQVQLVVLKEASGEPIAGDWAAVGDFDPAQPRLWDRMLRLPTMKMLPGFHKGPIGSEPTGTRQHAGTTWSTLKGAAWQAYPLPVSDLGTPHVLEVEFPSDLAQSLAISVIEPNAAGFVTPLGVDSGIDVVAVAGRAPRTLAHRLVFWPRTTSPLVLLANRRDDEQAVFGKIRVLAGPARLSAELPAADQADQRLVAAWFDKPLFPENFSVADSLDSRSGRAIDDWSVFLSGGNRLADYLRFSGHNACVLNVLCEGSALYPSRNVLPTPKYDMGTFSTLGNDPQRKDVAELLLRLFDRERLYLVPAIGFTSPLPELEKLLAESKPSDAMGIELVGPEGQRWTATNPTRRGVAPHYNLLDPRVQGAMRRVVREFAERYAAHPSLAGIAIHISGEGYAQLPDDAWGLDEVTLARFAADCRLDLPPADPRRPALRWQWIEREALPAWTEWRCREVTRFYKMLRDDLSAVDPDLQLWLCPVEPLHSRRLGQRVRPTLPPQDHVAEGLAQTGLDPQQLSQIPGVTLVRPRVLEPSLAGGNPLWAELNSATPLDQAAESCTPSTVLQYCDALPLRLEAFDKVSPFGPQTTHTFLLSHLSPVDAEARKRFTHSLAAVDAQAIFDGGQMLTLGQEDAVRGLLATFREIPAGDFAAVPPAAGADRTQPVTLRRWSSDDATWLYLVNDSPWPVIADVDLASATTLSLKTLGPQGKSFKLPSGAGAVHWKVRLEPYDLVAARVSAADVEVSRWLVQIDRSVDAVLREQLRDIRLRANLLRSPTPLATLTNASFEDAAGGNAIPHWAAAEGDGITVELDRRTAKEGGSSLHVISRPPANGQPSPVVWLRSDPIPTPTTGRLALWVWLKTRDVNRQPKLRLAIEGRLDGQPYYRRANVGASEHGNRSTQPLQEEWSPFLFPVDDLPASGLTDLQIGFDLMDQGEIWIDHVQVFDLWFQEIERDSLLKSIALADFQVQEGKVGDALRFTESYWPLFLRRHVPLDNARVAAVPEPKTTAPAAAPPPEKPGMFDGMRRWTPRWPFGRQ